MVRGKQARILHILFGLFRLATFGQMWPPVAVSGVIERDGKILLVDRRDGLGLCLPGGLVKWSETAKEALYREVLEETGLRIAVVGRIGFYDDLHRDPRFRCIEVAYRATIMDGQLRPSSEGPLVWLSKTPMPDGLAFDH